MFKKLFQILGINYIISHIQQQGVLPSGILLVLVNLIPVIGVIFWGWNVYDIVILYWLENVAIGICNIPKILFAENRGANLISVNTRNHHLYKIFNYLSNIFLAGFFIVHFGGFSFVHGFFIRIMMFDKSSFVINNDYSAVGAFFLALLISHGFSLIYNYIIQGEYKKYTSSQAMVKPYSRIFVIQLTIILGAYIVELSNDSGLVSKLLVLLFVFIKIMFDLGMHLRSHIEMQQKAAIISPEEPFKLGKDGQSAFIDYKSGYVIKEIEGNPFWVNLFVYFIFIMFIAFMLIAFLQIIR
jgi:hypothetical protein